MRARKKAAALPEDYEPDERAQGSLARALGMPLAANPFLTETRAWMAWCQGWLDSDVLMSGSPGTTSARNGGVPW
ncbi:conserved protein of unknown function (plasmid) [Rhodovastum atsumiense]|uniref:Uncharacterized protein n=1 Tax=Rhodovastum atsumiense TaxID=504468 RepID=A0A5M6IWJ8_9PROT|nr:hypothetical protein [Rhodovastum atsumiense]KAA5611838.1 hypothetical protein F1189_12440 [Rhodovastum atsumiense]CAH2606191.1 conserved protein of unknown function [Rhodovastum atsumiense]